MKISALEKIGFKSLYIKKSSQQKTALRGFVADNEKILAALDSSLKKIDDKSFDKNVYFSLNEAIIGNHKTGNVEPGFRLSLEDENGNRYFDSVTVGKNAHYQDKINALRYFTSVSPDFRNQPTIANIIERYSK